MNKQTMAGYKGLIWFPFFVAFEEKFLHFFYFPAFISTWKLHIAATVLIMWTVEQLRR